MVSMIDSTFIGPGPVDKGPFKAALDTAASEITALQNDVTGLKASIGTTYRNRIINGGMQISQERGTAFVDDAGGSGAPVYVIDQWQSALSFAPLGVLRSRQVVARTPGGSTTRLRAEVTLADAALTTNDIYSLRQPIEGVLISDAAFGTSNAKPLLLRIGVRSTLAGTYGVSIRNSALNRSWVGVFTIGAGEVNTDLVRTFNIPGDVSGTWAADNTTGMFFTVALTAAPAFQGVAGWQAGNFLTTSAQTNFMGTAGAVFELFDAGLYVNDLGATAPPPWELPLFDEELRRCERYYEAIRWGHQFTATVPGDGGGSVIPFRAVKRAVPSITAIATILNTNASAFNPGNIVATGAWGQIVSGSAGATALVVDLVANSRL